LPDWCCREYFYSHLLKVEFSGVILSTIREVTIYTDGGCIGNPGPGGYGVVLLCDGHRKELSDGFRLTTNNRMEIMAAIIGLESLKARCKVTLYSDSKYLVDAIMQGWANRWKQNGWYRNKKEKALNPDLWERILSACQRHDVEFVWVKGHAGNVENERCDVLSKRAALQTNLPADVHYEKVVGKVGG
jgi:ribonuclease HI